MKLRDVPLTGVLCMSILLAVFQPVAAQENGPKPIKRGALSDIDGQTFTSADLRKWIDAFMPPWLRQDMILVFSQCYGANWFQDFMDLIGSDTTMLAASQENKESTYGGVHKAYAENLNPSNTVRKMVDEGVKSIKGAASGDTVASAGNIDRAIGGSNSTHVLIWATNPNPQDWEDIKNIRNNFAGHSNTTVTVLAGASDFKDEDGNYTSKATKDNMKLALAAIGLLMHNSGPNVEQFILHVTDHGDIEIQEKVFDVSKWLEDMMNEFGLTGMEPEEREAHEEFMRDHKRRNSPASITIDIPPEGGESMEDIEEKVNGIFQIEIGPELVWNRDNPNDMLTITPQYLPSATDEDGDGEITWEDGKTFDGFQVIFYPEIPIFSVINPDDANSLHVYYDFPAPLEYRMLSLHIGPIAMNPSRKKGTCFIGR